MDPNSVVFDLSSDEDVGWDEKGSRGVGSGDDYDWIQKLLDGVDKDSGEVDKGSGEDSDDDVVVVSEVVVNPMLKKGLGCNVVKTVDHDEDDDDDDCVILDGDPDKDVAVQKDSVEDEADELLVVGETGQVACRDYPHPRHLCAKFPFTSTRHESHCSQCHCYVCDSLAPCLYWGTGVSSSDHCHATEKEEVWKHQRNYLKNGQQVTVSVPVASYPSTVPIQINQVPVLTPTEPYHVVQSEVPKPALIRACSRITNLGVRNTTNQSRRQLSGCATPMKNLQPNLVAAQLQNVDNNVNSRDRRGMVGNLGPQLNPAVFKRAGSHGFALTSDPRYISSNNRCIRYHPNPLSALSTNSSMRWQHLPNQMGLAPHTSQLPPQPSMQMSQFVPPQPQVCYQPNMFMHPMNTVPSQPQASPQPSTATVLQHSMPTHQPMVSSQQSIGNFFVNSVAPQPQIPSQAYVGGMSFQPQVSSQLTIGNNFTTTGPSESQADSQLNNSSDERQRLFAQENPSVEFLGTSLTDKDLSWVTPTGQSHLQPKAEKNQLHNIDRTEDSSSLAGIDALLNVSAGPVSLDFDYNWTSDHYDVPVHSPGPVLSDSGIFFGL